MKLLPLTILTRSLQSRVEMNNEYISELREIWREDRGIGKQTLPPVVVFTNGKGTFWLADGYHRCYSAELEGIKKVNCEERFGNERDAQLYAIGANKAHGLRRTAGDKRKAILLLLNDLEWSSWTQEKIAKHCGVSQQYVSKVRQQLDQVATGCEPSASSESEDEALEEKNLSAQVENALPAPRTVIGRDGKTYKIKPPKDKRSFMLRRVLAMVKELFSLIDSLHPEDRVEVRATIRAALEGKGSVPVSEPTTVVGQESSLALDA